ncbi:MAG TPA: transcriptional repressor [Firmicutes bacterium]|nr:transcriptional repressor [Bacillota bacterium]
MNAPEKARRLLEAKAVRPSAIRVSLLAHLLTHPVHPTADQLYQALLPEFPTLSKTSVYNTLDKLLQVQLVRLITIDEKETRYDADTAVHGHFFCKHCRNITDFAANPDYSGCKELSGHQITDSNVYLTGICKACLQNNNNKKQREEKAV